MKEYSDGNGEKKNVDENKNENLDHENQTKKLKYPRAVPFIIGNEFCERFNYYGLRTILVIYLSQKLLYTQNDSTTIYHAFAMLVYFMCIFGAIISDSWLGKFRTIFYLSLVYVAGSVVISLGAIPQLKLPANEITMLGLLLIAMGSGGIKPCVSAFGGDQFKLPEQAKQMATYFSLFYFSINSGSLISTTVTPILRADVHCFGEMSCYSLAFGVPAVLMIISVVIFVLGRPLYISKPAEGNMLLKVSKAIGSAISTRWKEGKYNPKPHWLDHATNKYGAQLIDDVKVLLRVLVLYIPLPVFWALFDQQGSRWTFQATRMNGEVGAIEIKPEQLQLINPFLILVFIPIFEIAFYPLLEKVGIRTPLRKLTMGGVLAGVAFVLSALVEIQLEKTYPVLPTSEFAQFRIYNGIPNCTYNAETNIPNLSNFNVDAMNMFVNKEIKLDANSTFTITLNPNESSNTECISLNDIEFQLIQEDATSYYLYERGDELRVLQFLDYVDKPSKGNPEVRILANLADSSQIVKLKNVKRDDEIVFNETHPNADRKEVIASEYYVMVGEKSVLTVTIQQGGEYTILLSQESTETDSPIQSKIIEVTEPNSLNILWLVPQYFVMTLGEVMFSVTGLQFSYTQAPSSMKSVLQACWLLTTALGNLIVIIVSSTKIFRSQTHEFFLFAGLMFVDMVLFAYLAYRYKPNNPVPDKDNPNNDENK